MVFFIHRLYLHAMPRADRSHAINHTSPFGMCYPQRTHHCDLGTSERTDSVDHYTSVGMNWCPVGCPCRFMGYLELKLKRDDEVLVCYVIVGFLSPLSHIYMVS